MSIAAAKSSFIKTTMNHKWLEPQFFAVYAMVVGLILVFLIPPFQAPDEPAHFLRAWQISEASFRAKEFGGELPISLGTCFQTYDSIRLDIDQKLSLEVFKAGTAIKLDSRERRYFRFANTAIYSPAPYLGSSAFMWAGRLICTRPLAVMYFGRLGNLVSYVLLGVLVLKQLPILKTPAMVILLSPVPMYLASSLSADAITTGFVFLATAQLVSIAIGSRVLTVRSFISLAVSLVMIQWCKWAYAPVAIFVLAISARRWGGVKWQVGGITVIAIFCLAAMFLWIFFSNAAHDRMHGADPPAQAHWILTHPFGYANVMLRTLVTQLPALGYSSMGAMGWQNALIPSWFVGLHFLVLVLLIFNESQSNLVTVQMRALAAIAVVLSVVLLFTLEYLGWNSVGAITIEGLQGRYFIPLALLGFLIFCNSKPQIIGKKFAAGWMIVCGTVCLAAVLRRFY